MSLSPGARLGPYEVLSRLGAGGMGEVYRATDTRLDRVVALKVLPPDRVGDSEARGRFAREAKAIAALSHPNICAIHDVGLADPAAPPYLVMELLDGQTLQERLLRGPLDIDQLVEFGVALADALDTAHARGIIHRDLKPANIVITSRGIPKILDFGLAKAFESGPGHAASGGGADVTRHSEDVLTELGTTVGTVAYMSPEQLRGETLDVRSDLFSFGLVLYEMATGQRAFAGTTSAVVSAAILMQEPSAPTVIRPDVPPRLEETILKALEKDRNVRCQTAAELRADLTRLKRQSGSQTTRLSVQAATMPPPGVIATMSGVGSAPGMPTSIGTASAQIVAAIGNGATSSANRGLWLAVAALAAMVILGGGYWLGSGRGGPRPLQSPPPPPPPASTTGTRVDAGPPPNRAPSRTGSSAAAATPSARPVSATPDRSPVTAPQPPPDPPAGRGGRGATQGRRGPGLPSLVSMLQGLPPLSFDLAYATGDDRARELAMGLRSALTSSGWTCVTTSEVAGQHSPLAVLLPQPSASATALINWARRNGFDPEVRPAPRMPRMRIVIGR